MAKIQYAIPGVGGSLGMCAVCGDTFTMEILLGQSIGSITMQGIDADLPVHKKCGELMLSLKGPYKEVRDQFPEGPIKRAFDELLEEIGQNL